MSSKSAVAAAAEKPGCPRSLGTPVPGAIQSRRSADSSSKKLWRSTRSIAGATFGLALARRQKDSSQQGGRVRAAGARDSIPKLVEAQELLAKLALEDNNEPKAIEEADKALKISPEALDAMAVRLAIDYPAR